MKLSSLIDPRLVKCGLVAKTKEEALREVVEHLAGVDVTLKVDELLQALQERERLGPFSMGKGAAFPHARTEKVKDFTVVLGTAPEGIDFKARDGQKIKIVVLFVIPKKHSNLYLHALAQFLNVFAHDEQTARIISARTPEDLIRQIDESPEQQKQPSAEAAEKRPAPPQISVTAETPFSAVVDHLLRHHLDAVPVVDAEGALTGEVSSSGVLALAIRNRIRSLSHAALLEEPLDLGGSLRVYGETAIRDVPGLISTTGYATVQEGETPTAVGVRLARTEGKRGYLLRGKQLVGVVRPADLLRRLAERH